MFLSRKWIFLLIAITGISFMILLVIQFGWISKSIELDRRHLNDKMTIISNKIRSSFLSDKTFQQTYFSSPVNIKDFVADINVAGIEKIIKQKVDSILITEKAPLSSTVYGRTGDRCYLMNYILPGEHNENIDRSQYKICLCNNSYPAAFDIGINLLNSDKIAGIGSSGLILPSVILILLLIGLFTYAIYIINRQKKLSELKNDFINNLTHEFNTPLFSIGLTSNLLSRSEAIHDSEKLKGYVELISTEKNRIQTQVDKILKLTAIESGNLVMEKEKIDIDKLITENINGFALVTSEKGGSISYKAGTNCFVVGDKVHLLNAFNNILDNACKYADRPPQIVITTAKVNDEIIISIEDNGIGMSKAEINMIFDKYYRVKHGDRHDVKGFGLGLSYVKKIIQLHGGTIEVNSKPTEGSTFIIHLPASS